MNYYAAAEKQYMALWDWASVIVYRFMYHRHKNWKHFPSVEFQASSSATRFSNIYLFLINSFLKILQINVSETSSISGPHQGKIAADEIYVIGIQKYFSIISFDYDGWWNIFRLSSAKSTWIGFKAEWHFSRLAHSFCSSLGVELDYIVEGINFLRRMKPEFAARRHSWRKMKMTFPEDELKRW